MHAFRSTSLLRPPTPTPLLPLGCLHPLPLTEGEARAEGVVEALRQGEGLALLLLLCVPQEEALPLPPLVPLLVPSCTGGLMRT